MTNENGIKLHVLNNDGVALIAWEFPGRKPIDGCLGLALTRIDSATGERTVLQTKLPFHGQQDNRVEWKSQPSTVWPIQRMFWLDRGKKDSTVSYELVPMVGTPGDLKPLDSMKVTSKEITFTTRVDDTFQLAFTNGTLSTQWLAHSFPKDADGLPDWELLVKAINEVGNPVRERLGGNLPEMAMEPIKSAVAEGGHVYANLYELAEPQLVALMLEHTEVFDLILGNTGETDESNAPARKALHEAGARIFDRMLGKWGIAHNKTWVRTNKAGKAKVVTSLSANHTMTGWFCQSNMGARIENDEIAEFFLDYWHRTKADKAQQSAAYRAENAKGKVFKLKDGTVVEVYFAPNTQDKVKPKDNPPTPVDMARVKELMYGAKSVIASCVFYPGAPSVVHYAADIWNTRPDLYMFMTVSNGQALRGVRSKWRKGRPPLFTVAQGREVEFSNFVKELLKLPEAHAITHGKIVVIDPFGDNPIVIFGSHNLGFKASYSNDENLIIVMGNKKFAQYVFVNMFDINSHYKARAAANAAQKAPWVPPVKANALPELVNVGLEGVGSLVGANPAPAIIMPDLAIVDPDKAFAAFDSARVKVDPALAASTVSRGFLSTNDDWQNYWLKGYKAREVQLLATGVWDGSGLE